MMKVELYEGVELIEPAGALPAGSHGVVVELYEDGRVAEVEFLDERGDTLAVTPIPVTSLRVITDPAGRPIVPA